MEIDKLLKSLNDRAQRISNSKISNSNPKLLLKSINKLYNSCLQDLPYDEAYISCKRFIYCIGLLKQNSNKEDVDKYFPQEKIQNIKKRIYFLENQIKRKFESENKLSAATKNSNIVNTSSKSNDEDVALHLSEISCDISQQPKERDDITCNELFEFLNQEKRKGEQKCLIIDMRSKEDYLESRIAFQDNLINIPADKIESKIVLKNYKFLSHDDEKVINQFNKITFDIIVLVDSNSSFDIKTNKNPIDLLKKYLEHWNIFIRNEKFVFLKGGYEEWEKSYPSMVKKHIKKDPTMKHNNLDNIFDYNNYDSLSSIENLSSPILCSTHTPGVKIKPSLSSKFETIKNETSITRNYIENNRQSNSSLDSLSSRSGILANDSQLMKEPKVLLQRYVAESYTKPLIKPPVDRSNKPNFNKKSTDTMSTLSNFIEVQPSLSHHSKIEVDGWSREQRDTLRKINHEKPKIKEQNELYPNLSLLELNKGIMCRPKQYTNSDKENIQELGKRVEQTKIEPQDPESMDVDDEKIYIGLLKAKSSNMNSGLKRSISSPNLMQVKKLKATHQGKNDPKRIPDFNRSLKPNRGYENTSYTRPISAISVKNREQRMEPVYASSGLHPGITGLKNLGNSCYMNSIIQCLSNTVYLAQYFISHSYINDLNKNTDKGVTGYVAEEVAQVIKALWRGQYKSISPRDLKVVVGQYKLQFESYDQQDSHEFLMFLLDWMHNDLKQKSKISYDRPLSTAEKEWEKSMDGQSSKISELFFGQLRSTIECVHCGKNSTTFETFNSLTMSLPGSSRCSLDDCVKKFVSSQKVSGWKCPNCKVPREGLKKFEIAKLPHIIVIHLNRFGDTGGWLEKKNTAVEFPLSNFTLRTYFSQDADNFNNSQTSNYNLYAMSNHYGTMDGGHYTAYCKSNTQNKWYKYDDHTVTEVHQNQVKSQSNSAYLLFYTSISAEPFLNS